MRIQVQIEVDLDVDPATSPPAFMARVSEAAAALLSGRGPLLVLNANDYILGPHRDGLPSMGEWLARGAPAPPDAVTLRLRETETCSHGSPLLPDSGFQCGWC